MRQGRSFEGAKANPSLPASGEKTDAVAQVALAGRGFRRDRSRVDHARSGTAASSAWVCETRLRMRKFHALSAPLPPHLARFYPSVKRFFFSPSVLRQVWRVPLPAALNEDGGREPAPRREEELAPGPPFHVCSEARHEARRLAKPFRVGLPSTLPWHQNLIPAAPADAAACVPADSGEGVVGVVPWHLSRDTYIHSRVP